MRLTLRTLLAYLDDTLDLDQAREIGPKVAESDVARELIEKIRRVMRKRGLGVPDVADANIVAEYLDNDLAGDKLAEVEEQALHSDVHLAEIAACHQLLTLITTEPAQVPPTARQRMYGLVKGPEADPNRVASRVVAATIAPEVALPDEPEGNPLLSHRGGRQRLIAAGVFTVVLAIAVSQVTWRQSPPERSRLEGPVAENNVPPIDDRPKNVEPSPAPKEKEEPKVAEQPKEQPKEKEKEMDKAKEAPKAVPIVKDEGPAPELIAARKPSDERVELGKHVGTGVLLQAVHDAAPWQRVLPNGTVFGAARLLGLPGLINEIRLGDAVIIELFGTLPDFQLGPFFESAATAYAPAKGFAADVRVDAGRVYIRAAKPGGAVVRLRLGDDVFDATLTDDQSELIAERLSLPDDVAFSRDAAKQAPPFAQGLIGITRGTAKLAVNLKPPVELVAPPKPKYQVWNSTNGPAPVLGEDEVYAAFWGKTPNVKGPERPMVMELFNAAKRLPQMLGDPKKDIGVAVSELAVERAPFCPRLALYAQAALDDVPPLLDALEGNNPELRLAAIHGLQQWLGRGKDRGGKLFDALMKQKGYAEAEAETMMKLFFGFDSMALSVPATYAAVIEGLRHETRLAIREAAFWRLRDTLDPEGARQIRYNPTDPPDARQRAYQDWKRRIPDGQLPPRMGG